jgi:hypothetical protein
MSSSRPKTRYIAELSIEQFIEQNSGHCWFWTFSEPPRFGDPFSSDPAVQARRDAFIGPLPRRWTKDEAEAAFKPFRDLCARREIKMLVVWERQDRGSWHPHVLVNRYLDVNFLRPWMMNRGWGQQMKAESLFHSRTINGGGWTAWQGGAQHVIRYLTKYLTKSRTGPADFKKKIFSASAGVKVGVTNFRWLPEIRPGAYLYFFGRSLFEQLYGEPPSFRDMMQCIRLGVEETGWADIDPLWEFGFG